MLELRVAVGGLGVVRVVGFQSVISFRAWGLGFRILDGASFKEGSMAKPQTLNPKP